jgi:hypothetical protein
MLCTRCGWEFDERIDCHCSGCGRILRGLTIVGKEKQHYTLFFGGGVPPLTLEIENPGELPIRIDKPWNLVGLESLSVTINRAVSPPVEMAGKERVIVEMRFDGSRMPFPQSGLLRIQAGIRPPLDIKIVCLPIPVFFFYVNGQLVRNGTVRIVTTTPSQPELLFKIEIGRCPNVSWDTFRLYPEGSHEEVFPLPSSLSFPAIVAEGTPLEFSLSPLLQHAPGSAPAVLRADFGFEHCSPQAFTIEIVESARIEHTQDVYPINENALIRGKSRPREIEITLKNHGGVEVEILQVCSLDEPWLSLASQPDNMRLLPYEKSKTKFRVVIDPKRIPIGDEETTTVNGRLAIETRGTDVRKILSIGVEMKPPEILKYPVAIDFGNSSTCVAFTDRREIRLVSLDEAYPKEIEFPTIIDFESFAEEGLPENAEGFRYGHLLELTRYAAGTDGSSNFLHRVWSFKRCLGMQSMPITRIDRKSKRIKRFLVEEIYGFYLKEVLRRFECIKGCTAREVVLTYPANLSITRKKRLSKMAHAALQIPVIDEISEPEALALHYFRCTPIERPLLFAVFDFGGGTTDISIGRIRMEDSVWVVSMLISIGLEDLGGDILSFDLAKDIYLRAKKGFPSAERLFPQEFGDMFRISLAERKKLYNFMSIMHLAEDLKTNRNGCRDELFMKGEVPLSLHEFYTRTDAGPEKCRVTYTLVDFNQVISSKIRRGFEKLHATFEHLREHGVIYQDERIDLLILGGNSSRLPIVRDLAASVLGLTEETILFDGALAKTGVATGAAYYGQMREDPDVDIVFENPSHLKYPLGKDSKGRFEVLFAAGSVVGEEGKKTAYCECNLRAPNPVLRLWWNHDPANVDMASNKSIHPAAEFSLKKYKKQYTSGLRLKLELVEGGVWVTPEGGEKPDFIPMEF